MRTKCHIRLLAVVLVLIGFVGCFGVHGDEEREFFGGVVYLDENQNGTRDAGEKGIPEVCVSNGLQVVETDSEGRYTLPVRDQMVVFVVKPADYQVPRDADNVPRFYYVHKPEGSPEEIKEFAGLEPTGEMPEQVNFPFYKSRRKDEFRVLVFGDTQVFNHQDIDYLRDGVIEHAADIDAEFALSLGDNVHNDLSLYPRYLSVMGALGMPTYYLPGNHDINFDSPDDENDTDTYWRYLGPDYYSFNVGKVHFVALNDVSWDGNNYHGELGSTQRKWLRNDLRFVPEDHLIVMGLHIPIFSWFDGPGRHALADREQLYEIMEGRKAISLVGHIHTLEHFRTGQSAKGSGPIGFPQVLAGAACGSWWSPPIGEDGVPMSYQREGAPKGYMVFEFDGADYRARYRVPGRPADYQMNISLSLAGVGGTVGSALEPEEVDDATVFVNFFAGDQDSEVKCRLDGDTVIELSKNTEAIDPYANRRASKDHRPVRSSHLWTGTLPDELDEGTHRLEVTAEDMYGQTHHGLKLFEVRTPAAVGE